MNPRSTPFAAALALCASSVATGPIAAATVLTPFEDFSSDALYGGCTPRLGEQLAPLATNIPADGDTTSTTVTLPAGESGFLVVQQH